MPRPPQEPAELTDARTHLAHAEAALATADGLTHLQEGLELLESVADDRDARTAALARQLGATYAKKVHEHVRRELASGRNLPEPALQHAFALLRCFDGKGFEVPPTSRETKIELVRRLIDIHYEGYPEADKQRAYEELAEIARSSGKD
ncbi:MAG TPA: hypothetical protein VF339_02995 [Gammaproteobacteria bacterium]